jgi:hypothetical protein
MLHVASVLAREIAVEGSIAMASTVNGEPPLAASVITSTHGPLGNAHVGEVPQ